MAVVADRREVLRKRLQARCLPACLPAAVPWARSPVKLVTDSPMLAAEHLLAGRSEARAFLLARRSWPGSRRSPSSVGRPRRRALQTRPRSWPSCRQRLQREDPTCSLLHGGLQLACSPAQTLCKAQACPGRRLEQDLQVEEDKRARWRCAVCCRAAGLRSQAQPPITPLRLQGRQRGAEAQLAAAHVHAAARAGPAAPAAAAHRQGQGQAALAQDARCGLANASSETITSACPGATWTLCERYARVAAWLLPHALTALWLKQLKAGPNC